MGTKRKEGGPAKGKEGKRIQIKLSFSSPYSQWNRPVGDEKAHEALLHRVLSFLGPHCRPRGPTTEAASSPAEGQDGRGARSLLVGFNEVTRALEEGAAVPLSAVLACVDDLSHPQVLEQLPFQCRLRRIGDAGAVLPVALPRGSSEELSRLFAIPRISVIGIPQGHPVSTELTEYLASRTAAAGGDGRGPTQELWQPLTRAATLLGVKDGHEELLEALRSYKAVNVKSTPIVLSKKAPKKYAASRKRKRAHKSTTAEAK